jgi:hypothetical protein
MPQKSFKLTQNYIGALKEIKKESLLFSQKYDKLEKIKEGLIKPDPNMKYIIL